MATKVAKLIMVTAENNNKLLSLLFMFLVSFSSFGQSANLKVKIDSIMQQQLCYKATDSVVFFESHIAEIVVRNSIGKVVFIWCRDNHTWERFVFNQNLNAGFWFVTVYGNTTTTYRFSKS